MSLALTIDTMLAAGCTTDQMAAVVRAHESEREAVKADKRAKAAERQRRSRASRNVTVTERDSALHRVTPPETKVPLEVPPSTPFLKPSKTQPPHPPINPPAPRSDFDRFWAAYPKRVCKAAAVKAFQAAMRRTTLESLLDGVGRAAAGRSWREGFIPYPATWLNQDRWLDEIDATPTPAREANWRELERQNNENASLGAQMVIDEIRRQNAEKANGRQDSAVADAAVVAFPQVAEDAHRAGGVALRLHGGP